ncbi:MAG: TolC family protein [Flavobacteriaceae bacterium]|nr:TolC family protein [Flavobacteriaceae bacterium]
MKNKLILILMLCLTMHLAAQNTVQNFSLDEAIQFALENNRIAKNASRDIEAAEKQKWETIATGLPQLSAYIDYNNWIKQQVSLLPGEIVGGEPGTFVPIAFGTKQTVNATAILNQKIFDGSYIVGLQSAKVFLQISEMAKEKTDLEVRRNVINTYGNVLMAEEGLTILESNIAVLEKNIFETTKMFENGLDEEESVEQLQITLAGLQSSLNYTKRLKTLSYQMLNIVLGQDINVPISLSDSLENLTLINLNDNLLNAPVDIENNIDYQIAQNELISKELLVKLEKSRALPQVDAFINGGYSGNNENFQFLNNNQQWYGSSLFGVSMQIPIFSSLERTASTQRAQINLEIATDNLTEVEQQLMLQIETAKNLFQLAVQDYENKKLSLALAERIEAKNETKFFEGISSSFDLRQAQTQLYTTQQEYLNTMLDVITTKADLETLLNTINQ